MQDLAERIYNLDIFGFQDSDGSPEAIAEAIKTEPETVIKYLLDYIEEIEN